VVTATDACGNVGPEAAFTFQVDTTAPSIALGTVSAPANTGIVALELKPSEPLASAVCALDGVPCECVDTNATCREASAGEHVFTIQGTDAHGNVGGTIASKPFEVTYGPNAGHAILIGHDFMSASEDTELLLRNAFEEVPYRARGLFDRSLRVAMFRQASVPEVEADNALAAVAEIVDADTLDEFSDPGTLQLALRGKDVLLIPDQQDPEGIAAIGKVWQDTLTTFLNRGGVVVVLDGMVDATDTVSQNYAALGDGILGVTASYSFGAVGSTTDLSYRFDDANDLLHPEDISPISIGASYVTTPSTVIFYDQDTGGPRWVYTRILTICTIACFKLYYPIVIDKTFPVYTLATALPTTTGPHGSVPFRLSPATDYDRIDCTVTNLSCYQTGTAPPCACGGASRCACVGDAELGFVLSFATAGSYQVALRLIDPFGSPGRSAIGNVSIDVPTATITPSTVQGGTYTGVFCYHGGSSDSRALGYKLTFNGNVVKRDPTRDASCAAADVGSYHFTAICNNITGAPPSNIFRVDATDLYGNSGYSYVSWTVICVL